jgi:hypothetical protein
MGISASAAMAADCPTPKISGVPELPSITRGNAVTVNADTANGGCFPSAGVKAILRTGKEQKGDNGLPQLDAKVSEKGDSLSFQIPQSFPTGRYLVFLTFDSKELQVPGDLNVLSDALAKVSIDSISPSTIYPTDKSYEFEITGENLGKAAGDNIVEVVGRGPQTVVTSYDAGMEGRKLKVTGFKAGDHDGSVNIRVRVGNNVSDPKPVTLSMLPEWMVRVWRLQSL